MICIRPSIASADPLRLADEICRLGDGNRWLHIDLEDGNHLHNISFGMKVIRAIVEATDARCDVHITARDPMGYVDELADMGVEAVSFHFELMDHPSEGLMHIRKHGMKAGLALEFKTLPEQLEMYADLVDYVLVMTSEPDGIGENFRPLILNRIRKLRKLLPAHVQIWADGGINQHNLSDVVDSGADTVVMGRAIWAEEDPEAAVALYANITGDSH